MFKMKRVYDDASGDDGYRVLVDRLWPRGLSKEEARVDRWLKDVAPSGALRRWFGHDPGKWEEFQARYAGELRANPTPVEALRQAAREHGMVTLLYAAKDSERNNAVVLLRLLRE